MKFIVDKMPDKPEECVLSRVVNLTPYPLHYLCLFGDICNINNCKVLKPIGDCNLKDE